MRRALSTALLALAGQLLVKVGHADRVKELMASMSIEQKVGQLIQLSMEKVFKDGTSEIDVDKLKALQKKLHPGAWGGAPFSNHYPKWGQTYWNVSEYRRRVDVLHSTLKELDDEIPVLVAWDAGHGASYLYNGTVYPHQIGAAASFSRSLLKQMGRTTSRESAAAGYTWIMMPVVNLGVHPRWGRNFETFGEDPFVAGELGAAMIRGIQGEKISVGAAKHFIAYEAPTAGIERGAVEMHPRTVLQYHAPPFKAAVDAGVWTIMESFNEISGVPVVSSTQYLRDVVRHRLGFEGVLHCDWEEVSNMVKVHKVASSNEEAIRISLEETDIDMPHMADVEWMLEYMINAVKNGTLPLERIDRSVERVLRMKEWLGMFKDDHNPTPLPITEVGKSEHRDGSYRLALESMTLLKNEDSILPLKKHSKILVTGPTANSLTYLNGGWTMHWQGPADESELAYGTTVAEGVSAKAPSASFMPSVTIEGATVPGVKRDDLLSAVDEADVVIVCLGEANYAEKTGELLGDPHLPQGQLDLVRDLAATGKPVILVLIEGRPRLLGEAADAAKAILMAYLPGPEGGRAIADTLFGDHNPAGRLPFTYPSLDGLYSLGVPYYHRPTQLVLNYSSPHPSLEPVHWLPPPHQYPFGHGLSYSTFAYSNLRVSPKTIMSVETPLTVSVDVTNQGPTMAGQHTVLLFLYDEFRRVTPEAKMLKGFDKVELGMGETTTVTFTLGVQKDLSYIGIELRSVLENGDFFVGIGPDVDCRRKWDDRLCARFSLELSDDEYNPICEAACDAWTDAMPRYCAEREEHHLPTAAQNKQLLRGRVQEQGSERTPGVDRDTCLATCRAEGDWGWNYVECLEQEALSQSCAPQRHCRQTTWAT